MNETSAATVTTAGDMTYADAANSMGNRLAIGAASTMLVSTGSAPVWRAVDYDNGDASYTSAGGESQAPTTYAGFDATGWGGSGSVVDVSVTTGTSALVFYGFRAADLAAADAPSNLNVSYDVSGATTIAASDAKSILIEGHDASSPHFLSGCRLFLENGTLTAGSNTFTLEAKTAVNTDDWTVRYPWIGVMAL